MPTTRRWASFKARFLRERDDGPGLVGNPGSWCERGDSNPHGLPHWHLKPARLPVPPLSRSTTGPKYIVQPIGDAQGRCFFRTCPSCAPEPNDRKAPRVSSGHDCAGRGARRPRFRDAWIPACAGMTARRSRKRPRWAERCLRFQEAPLWAKHACGSRRLVMTGGLDARKAHASGVLRAGRPRSRGTRCAPARLAGPGRSPVSGRAFRAHGPAVRPRPSGSIGRTHRGGAASPRVSASRSGAPRRATAAAADSRRPSPAGPADPRR